MSDLDPELHVQQLLYENQQLQAQNNELVSKVHEYITEITSLKSSLSTSAIKTTTTTEYADSIPSRGDASEMISSMKQKNKSKIEDLKKKHQQEYNALLRKYESLQNTLSSIEKIKISQIV